MNLMNVTDPAVPFSLVAEEFREADIVFSNLECCLYRPPSRHSVEHEGFFADPAIAGEALQIGRIQAVGIANNVNYGEAAIMASIARLDELGIAHTGAGANRALARAPVILTRDGVRFGFLQRSSVYWPTNHEAGEDTPGIAVIRGHTAYHVADARQPSAGQPPRHSSRDRDLGGPRLSAMARGGHRGVAAAGGGRRRLVPLGAAQRGPALHEGDRPSGDRRRRRPRDRPWAALFAADRGLQGCADLLWARQLFVSYRPRRQSSTATGSA